MASNITRSNGPVPQYIFGGDTGQTPESVRRTRELARMIMGRHTAPRNIGEGFAALASGIVANVQNRRADQAETAGRSEANSVFRRLISGLDDGAGADSYAPPVAPTSGGSSGTDDDFMDSLIGSESGGNWGASNNEVGSGGARGHFGRLQFGQARLEDAMNAGVLPQGTTPEQFMASPELQQQVEAWHFNDIDQQAARLGLNQYVGQTVGGVPITQDAIRAMAHLGGIGGAQRFLESGGEYNPQDAYGTSLLDYARQHGGSGAGQRTKVASLASNIGGGLPPLSSPANATAAPPQPRPQQAQAQPTPQQPAPAPVQAAQGPSLGELIEAASMPWMPDDRREMINSLIEQELQRQDPAYQQGMEMNNLRIQQLQQQIADGNFEARPLSQAEMQDWGLPSNSGTWIMGPDNIPVNLWAAPQGAPGFDTITLQLPDGSQQTFNTAVPEQAAAANQLLTQGAIEATSPPSAFQALQLRAEAAGLQPGTLEYQQFMAQGGGSQGQDSSASEEKIARIEELGYTRDEAIVIADLSVLAQDETGRQQVIRRDTGQPIAPPSAQQPTSPMPQPQQPAPQPQGNMSQAPADGPFLNQEPSFSTVPEGTDVGAALGIGGVGAGIINSITDFISGRAAVPDQQQAENALDNLRMQTITALMEPIAGRPSVFTQEMLDQIVVRPGQGPSDAMDRFQQTQTMIDQQIRRIDEQILNNPENWTPDEVRAARTQRNNMSALRDTYADMIESLENPPGNRGRPPLESFERP